MTNPQRGSGRATPRCLLVALGVLALTGPAAPASAQWLLGFSPAATVAPGHLSAITGTGTQVTSVGDPGKLSLTPFIPHAGIRVGLANGVDVGYRLVQVAIPYSSAGPTLGAAMDVKLRLTGRDAGWQAAIVAGGGFAFLQLQDVTRLAWSPGADLILSHPLSPRHTLFIDLRLTYTAIPTAAGGSAANSYAGYGSGVGLRIALTERQSLIPEVGLFRLAGQLGGQTTNGIGLQAGVVLGFAL